LVLLIALFLAPSQQTAITRVEQVPERFAKLILKQPEPPAQVAQSAPVSQPLEDKPAPVPEVEAPKPEPKPKPEPVTPRRPSRTQPETKLSSERGQQGRERAQREVSQSLANVSSSVDEALSTLSNALPASKTSDPAKPARRGRRRSVRGGRSGADLGTVAANASGASADLSGTADVGSPVSVAEIQDVQGTGAQSSPSAGSGSGSGSGSTTQGDIRSNASLLAVVRRYAPGIQYCYDNELKSDPSLRGKLVVSMTVSASGKVVDALVIEDTLRSSAARECVLSQIVGWKFPAIEEGDVSFKTPFVFTPPK
jgi:outer membrane biosynthesis protein TonB